MTRAGIREVAKAAGVSISTVSRAFTRPDLVSEKTRAKVLTAADKLDFNISRSATALKSGQTYRVALLMNEDITSWFNNQLVNGINSIMQPAGYDISLFQRIDSAEQRRAFFTNLPVRRNVDAVFVASFAIDSHEVEQLQRIHVPLIGINTPSTNCFDASVSIADEQGMFTATQHLLNLGHRNLVYVCAEPVAALDSSVDTRRHGFIRACETAQRHHAHGDIRWQVISVPRGTSIADDALSALLALPEFPDAICCSMDMLAIPLVIKLNKYGHHAPQDYSIIGFDDSLYAGVLGLTTMRQDPYATGRAAAAKALALINGKIVEQPHETVDAQLILRDTDQLRGA